MKNWTLLILTCLFYSLNLSGQDTVCIQIHCFGANIVSNDKVGNEWLADSYVNGEFCFEDLPMFAFLNRHNTITVKSVASEGNEAFKDIAEKIGYIDWTNYKEVLNTPTNIYVKVTETNGRYAGNHGIIEFKYLFTRTMVENELVIISSKWNRSAAQNSGYVNEITQFRYIKDLQLLTYYSPSGPIHYDRSWLVEEENGNMVIYLRDNPDEYLFLSINIEKGLCSFIPTIEKMKRDAALGQKNTKVHYFNEIIKR